MASLKIVMEPTKRCINKSTKTVCTGVHGGKPSNMSKEDSALSENNNSVADRCQIIYSNVKWWLCPEAVSHMQNEVNQQNEHTINMSNNAK